MRMQWKTKSRKKKKKEKKKREIDRSSALYVDDAVALPVAVHTFIGCKSSASKFR